MLSIVGADGSKAKEKDAERVTKGFVQCGDATQNHGQRGQGSLCKR